MATDIQNDIVPHPQARQLALDCARGGDVTHVPVILLNLGDKILTNHLAPLIADQGDVVSWLTDHLAGRVAIANCRTLPVRP